MTRIFLTWWNISIIHQSTTFLAQTCSHTRCWLVFVEKEDELSCQMTLGWWSLVHTTSSHVWKRHPPHALTEIYASILFPSHLILSFQSVLLISIILYICSITCFSHQKVLAMAASAAEVAWFICHMELTRKMRGGGICFYINEGWRTDVTVLGGKKNRPSFWEHFHKLWTVLFTVGVLLLCSGPCLQHTPTSGLADHKMDTEQKHPGFLPVILESFNVSKFSCKLLWYRQHLKNPPGDTTATQYKRGGYTLYCTWILYHECIHYKPNCRFI